MGEALEMVKENLKLNNEEKETKKVDSPETTLDKTMSWRESVAASRIRISTMERMALEEENEARRLKGEPPIQGGQFMDEETKRKNEEDLRNNVSSTAMILLEKGVDPKIVGQYIMGGTPVTPITLGPPPGGQQGLTIEDVKTIMDMASENKGTGELKEVLEGLRSEIASLKSTPPVSPPDPNHFAKQQAEQVKTWYDTLRDIGLVKEGTPPATGESIETVKEHNRHAEKMEEIKTDKDYKTRITDIAGDIPESIGRGIGARHTKPAVKNAGNELPFIPCSECGEKIYITPDTGNVVTCAKCGTPYTRRATGENKPEESKPEETK